jgi:hypothetical protein
LFYLDRATLAVQPSTRSGRVHGPASSGVSAACGKEFVSIAHLRVGGILDLQPRGAPPVRLIGAVRPLPDDAFQITLAGHAKEITAALLEMIEV